MDNEEKKPVSALNSALEIKKNEIIEKVKNLRDAMNAAMEMSIAKSQSDYFFNNPFGTYDPYEAERRWAENKREELRNREYDEQPNRNRIYMGWPAQRMGRAGAYGPPVEGMRSNIVCPVCGVAGASCGWWLQKIQEGSAGQVLMDILNGQYRSERDYEGYGRGGSYEEQERYYQQARGRRPEPAPEPKEEPAPVVVDVECTVVDSQLNGKYTKGRELPKSKK